MKLVIVEWQDSRQPDRGWQWLDERDDPKAVKCLTVGWLLRETEDAILVAQNLGDVTDGRTQFSGGTEIARRQIVQLKELTCPSWAKTTSSDPVLA
jgi:hypothetical protein